MGSICFTSESSRSLAWLDSASHRGRKAGRGSGVQHPLKARRSQLISDAANGDRRALSTLLESARPSVYQWAEARTRDPDDAEDITQLVLIRLIQNLPKFRGDSKLSSWLYRITVHEVSGFLRSRKRERTIARSWPGGEEETVSPPFDPECIDRERTAGVVRQVAATLPTLQQEAFRLVDLDGLKPCEAARELGKAQVNIRSSLCRARKKVRELVEECRAEGIEPTGRRA